MGIFERLASCSFKQSADGRYIFYPWGTLGRGFFLTSVEEFESLKRRIKTSYIFIVGLFISAKIVSFFQRYPEEYDLYFTILCLTIFILIYIYWVKIRCRQLQQADIRLTIGESLENAAWAYGWVALWSLEICSTLFVLMGLALLIFMPDEWLIALVTIAFFGACTATFTFMLSLKRRGKRKSL